jgi:hypothetical protein
MYAAPQEIEHFYQSGALGLRALQDRGLGTERFSPEADARWKAFCGDLTQADRLDLLLRDGAVLHPMAFSAAAIFALPNLATDEPFGPDWVSMKPAEAGALLRSTAQGVGGTKADKPSVILEQVAKIWGLSVGAADVSKIVPASRVVVAGCGAIIALADCMAGRPDMDFSDQLLLVSDQPGERQLFGLASALCGSRIHSRWVRSDATLEAVFAMKFDRATAMVLSSDVDSHLREGAMRIGQGLGVEQR